MKTSQYIRIFFAIELSPEVKNILNGVIAKLQKNYKKEMVRFVKPDNLHVTLQFLEKMSACDINNLVANVRAETHLLKSFKLQLHHLELFPTAHDARIISVSVGPQKTLVRLSSAVGDGMKAAGFLLEEHAFRGHITLGRIQHGTKLSLENFSLPTIKKFSVNEITLFHSEPQPEGSLYTPIAKIKLKERTKLLDDNKQLQN